MPDDRSEWLTWRRQGVGASDVASILSLSKWGSPFSVFADKTGMIPPDDTDDPKRKFGRMAERMIVPWFEEECPGLHVIGEQTWCESPDNPIYRCTTDGFVAESPNSGLDGALGLLQIKTTGPGKRFDELPPDWQAQEQYEMHVTGFDRTWLAVLHGWRLEVYELARDQADIDFIVGAVDRFWNDHVLSGEPPPLDGHDATLAALAALYPDATPKLEHALDGCTDALALLREAKRWGKAAAELEASAKAVLVWSMGPAAIGTVDGRKAATLGSQTRKATCESCGHVKESDPFRVLRLAGEWA